ncbi:GNAT family N-acetyltransferase [Kribbella sp. NPDC048915]|uniref:GNAT family N-acetyltransferase n=1 Tax=Kribbella sp. NPDC048915 TaxID=3155148 RepID=UPI0033CE533B
MTQPHPATASHSPTSRPAGWVLRPATDADDDVLAELRAVVLRPDLERLGRYDEHRVQQRFRDSFSAEHTRIIELGGALAGSITLRPDGDARLLEHFYLDPRYQGQGLGTAILKTVLAEADAHKATVRLNVLQGSPARRLYARHGFRLEREDPIDVFMVREFL